MARLHLVIDFDDVDPAREDSHYVVDGLLALGRDLPPFAPGQRWTRAEIGGARWVYAEWEQQTPSEVPVLAERDALRAAIRASVVQSSSGNLYTASTQVPLDVTPAVAEWVRAALAGR